MAHVSISDAEWQVMNVVWEGQPLTSQEIVAQLEQQGNRYVYRSCVRRADCVKQASRSFLQRVFESEPAPLLAHFMQTTKLSAEEIADLRRILDKKEAQK